MILPAISISFAIITYCLKSNSFIMRNTLVTFLFVGLIVCCCSCDDTNNKAGTASVDSSQKDNTAVRTDDDYTSSLRSACEQLNKALADNDSATRLALLDPKCSITARGETFTSFAAFKAHAQKQSDPRSRSEQITNKYDIEEVKAGTHEPVWAGYEKGSFEQVAKTPDGTYNRKVSGPYYRAWKRVDGQWKCYHIVVMIKGNQENACRLDLDGSLSLTVILVCGVTKPNGLTKLNGDTSKNCLDHSVN
jgi:hypothetical protein